MNIVSIKNLIHKFIDRDENGDVIAEKVAINNLSLDVKKGQFIAVLGHNGSGKSTLAKHINAILYPTTGSVEVAGMDTTDTSKLWEIRQKAGMVFQNPDNQIIATIVEEDVGFGPENLGVPTDEIWKRVDNALAKVGMTEYRKHSPNKLSGGQKQRVAIAGVVAMKPQCIILDEPTAMLDPNGRKEVISTIKELNEKEGVTIILVTHYMDEVVDADKVFVMDKGNIAFSGTPYEVFGRVDEIKRLGLDVPQITEFAHILKQENIDGTNRAILKIDELEEAFAKNKIRVADKVIDINEANSANLVKSENEVSSKNKASAVNEISGPNKLSASDGISGEENKDNAEEAYTVQAAKDVICTHNTNTNSLLEICDLKYVYAPGTAYEKVAVNNVNFKINKGEFVGIIGHTGSGKSTLIQHLNGLIKPTSGEVLFCGRNIFDKGTNISDIRKDIGLVFQYPEYQLFESTILEDVAFGPKNMGISKDAAKEMAREALELVGIGEKYYERSPFELSGGEKRRVAIAGMLAMKPEILILDEPTAGLDPIGREKILSLLKRLQKEEGLTIILVSHSMEDMAKYSDRVLVMNKGNLIYDDAPKNIFAHVKELESMGLAAPQIVYVMDRLKKFIPALNVSVKSVDEAVVEIRKHIKTVV